MIPRNQGPMLASPSKLISPNVEQVVEILDRQKKWIFGAKEDGIRCLVFVEDGAVWLMNRRGVEISARYPELMNAFAHLYAKTDACFDGEIVCLDPHGEPDFKKVHTRDAQQNQKRMTELLASSPATFRAFDILHRGQVDLRRAPYEARLQFLECEAQRVFPELDNYTDSKTKFVNTLQTVEYSRDGADFWKRANERGLEGLIAKRTTSSYTAGRSRDWVKIKKTFSFTAIAIGLTAGQGSREETFGAIKMGLIDDGKVVHVGEVGTGMNDAEIRSIKARMEAGELLIMEIGCQNVNADHTSVRFPTFQHLRTDLEVTDCTIDQLDRIPVV